MSILSESTDLSLFFEVSSWSFLFLLEHSQKYQKVLLIVTCFVVQTYVFQPNLLHFSVKMSIESFLLETDYSFLNIKEIVFYIRLGIPIDQIWQSVISIEISRFSNQSFSKTKYLKFLSRCKFTLMYFQMFIGWKIQWFCPLLWSIDRLHMRKCRIIVLILSIFRLINI